MTETGRKGYHSVVADAVEDVLWDKICLTLANPDAVLAQIKALSDTSSAEAVALQAAIDQAQRDYATVDAETDRLLDLYLKGKLDEERYTSKSEELTVRRQALQDRIAELTATRDAALARELPLEDIEAALQRVAHGTSTMTLDERRETIGTFCLGIYATREQVSIEADLSAFKATVPMDDSIENTMAPHCV